MCYMNFHEAIRYVNNMLSPVSRNVLKGEYHTSNELDEVNPDPSADQNDVYDDESIPPAPKLQGNFTHTTNQPSTSATNTPTVFRGDKGTTSDVDYWIAGSYFFVIEYMCRNENNQSLHIIMMPFQITPISSMCTWFCLPRCWCCS